MQNKEFRENAFINNDDTLRSFSLRASAIIFSNDKYLMVLNEGANKYKHPGGHIYLNESLADGLKRELLEEIGLSVDEVDSNNVFFDRLLVRGNIMINALFQIEISPEVAEKIISTSSLPTKLLGLDELNGDNTWQSEISAIEHFLES